MFDEKMRQAAEEHLFKDSTPEYLEAIRAAPYYREAVQAYIDQHMTLADNLAQMAKARVYELTDLERVIKDVHSRMMDYGFSPGRATEILTGSVIPDDLRTSAPELDAVLTPQFIRWLGE